MITNPKDLSVELGAYSAIKTDTAFNDSVPGAILLNLSGELVGMSIGKVGGKSSYLPSNIISGAIAKVGKAKTAL